MSSHALTADGRNQDARQALHAPGRKAGSVLALAACLGLLSGLFEAGGMLLVQELTPRTRYVSVDVLWAAPAVSMMVFIVIGAFAYALSRTHRVFRSPWFTFFPMAFLLSANVLEVASLTVYTGLLAAAVLSVGLATAMTRWYGQHEATVLAFSRRRVLAVLLVVPFIFGGVRGAEEVRIARAEAALTPALDQPNVLVVVLDALRADHMSAYGYHRPTTPNIDRLAREGVLYEHAFSTSPWSLPAHATLLTGQLPSTVGVGWSDAEALTRSTDPVLPEVLRNQHYRTGAFSANTFWVTHERFGRGFIEFDDYYYSIGDILARVNFGRALERLVLRRLGVEDIPARRRAPDISDALLGWIDREPDQPFFAFVNYFDVHDPYLPPEPHRTRYTSAADAGGILNWRVGRSDPELTAAEIRSEIDAYDGAINYLDEEIGALRDALEDRGILDNTVVIITSDHGESFGEHGWFLHGHSLYMEQLHVPLIVRWPPQVPGGVRVTAPVSIAGIPDLVMQLTGGSDVFPGAGLHAAMYEGTGAGTADRSVSAETEKKPWAPAGSPSQRGDLRAVIEGCWHLIQPTDAKSELYDWCVDPLERRNMAPSPSADSMLRRLTGGPVAPAGS